MVASAVAETSMKVQPQKAQPVDSLVAKAKSVWREIPLLRADTQAEPDNASKGTPVAKPASNASSLFNFFPKKTEATSSPLQAVKLEPTGQAHVIIPGVIVVSSGTGSGVSRSPSPEPESEDDDTD